MIDNSRGGAESLSTDAFQGLSEVVQNANDVAATVVSFMLDDDVLEVRHNGRAVNLRDLRAMAVPWLTTKSDDAAATGRFGVGLSTLHRFAETFEVHSGHYHVQVGDPFVSNLLSTPDESVYVEETVLKVAFREGAATEAEFLEWCDRWDDAALMFLGHVRKVVFATPHRSRTLQLDVGREAKVEWELDTNTPESGIPTAEQPADAQSELIANRPDRVSVTVRRVTAADGRRWLLSTCEVPSPPDVDRVRKRKGATTPIGIALPLFNRQSSHGVMYAGLPVVDLPVVPALVNAQFDPFTTRQGLQNSDWNFAVARLAAGLWLRTMAHLFDTQPRKAWRCVPALATAPNAATNHGSAEASSTDDLVDAFRLDLIDRATNLASHITFPVDGEAVPLGSLAVEAAPLSRHLTDDEVARLAELPRRLPEEARDKRGVWRSVLTQWRATEAALPAEVTVADALRLFDGQVAAEPDISRTINLTAVALDAGLATLLGDHTCVINDRGERVKPPQPHHPRVLVRESGSLAQSLGFGEVIHPEYLMSTGPSTAVLDWLTTTHRLIGPDDVASLERLATAGAHGNPIEAPLKDEHLAALRTAMEPLGTTEWRRLGPNLGRAIFIRVTFYDTTGTEKEGHALPCQAYQPRQIEGNADGFQTAAGPTPGLRWAHRRYNTLLKSELKRDGGLGASRLLRVLGCLTAPRLAPHAAGNQYYRSSYRKGVPQYLNGGPAARSRALVDLDANWTLDDYDYDSLDLTAVLQNIARDTNNDQRRKRASAILATLRRGWRELSEHASVDAAHAHHTWHHRGTTRAFWLWRASSIPWLENAAGQASTPSNLRRQSESNRALFGNDPSALVHPGFADTRPEILDALGVYGEPNTMDLVRRLRELRGESATDETFAECGVIYQALANRVRAGRESLGLTERQLVDHLSQRGGLIRISEGWCTPAELLRGRPIFGTRRQFTPPIPRTDPLWRALRIPEPRLEDCINVLVEIGKTKHQPTSDDETIIVDTLRTIDQLLQARRQPLPRRLKDKLRTLPLWTSIGWHARRPVYSTDDHQLALGIGTDRPMWLPGVDPAQFQRLFNDLRITALDRDLVRVADPSAGAIDETTTRTFTRILDQFKSDLTRNAPVLVDTMRIAWTDAAAYEVRIDPALKATLTLPNDKTPLTIPIRAMFDAQEAALFISDIEEIERVEGVARALATLFTGDARPVTHAWLAAVLADREGQHINALTLAAEHAERDAAAAALAIARLEALSTDAADAHDKKQQAAKKTAAAKNGKKASTAATPAQANDTAGNDAAENDTTTPADAEASPVRKPRFLVNPDNLFVKDIKGKIVHGTASSSDPPPDPSDAADGASASGAVHGNGSSPKHPKSKATNDSGTAPVDKSKPPPKRSTTYRAYSEDEKERLGIEIASRVLKGDAQALQDIRNQRGVGADAIDDLERFYELKVFGREEHNTVRLEPSQIRLALTEPNFFLVIVSNLEGPDARPTVRVISDPINQLTMKETSVITYSGIQEATSLMFTLDQDEEDGPAPAAD